MKTTYRRDSSCSLFSIAAIVAFIAVADGLAAPDDFDEKPMAQPVHEAQFNMVNINVDQQIFQHHSSEQTARDDLKESLQLQIDAIDLVCHLEESQKKKLLLAAQGDMTRFFSLVAELRQKYSQTQNNGNIWNEFWQQVQPIQMKYSQGLFQDNSLFEKTLRATLSEEQFNNYNAMLQERKNQLFRTRYELAVMEFEKIFPVRGDQRERIVDLLSKEKERFSNQAEMPQAYWILRLPEAKMRPIFDDWQWKKLEPQIRQFNPRPILNNRNIINLIPFVR